MEATCWSDYLCPWCYVGQDRSAQIAAGRERFWWKHIAQQYRDFFVQLS